LNQLLRIVSSSLLALGSLRAQPADTPNTRTEQIQREREAKAKKVQPEDVSKAERVLRDIKDQHVLERITAGYNGLRLVLGNMVTGSGFAAGPEYKREDLLNGQLTARGLAQGSTRLYTRLETEANFPRLLHNRLDLDFLATRRDYNSLPYYGPGPRSRKTGRSDFRLEDVNVDGLVAYKLIRHLAVGSSLGLLWTNVGPGQDDRFISADVQFRAFDVPGLEQQTNFWRSSFFGQYDYRDNPEGAKSGGNYIVSYSFYNDRKLDRFSFRRFDAEAQQFIPLLNKTRRIALRAKGVFTETDRNDAVPFYLAPFVGGADDLRGYRFNRFNDRNAVVYTAEYQYEIFSGLDGAVFFDAGKVMPRGTLLSFSDLQTDAGFGLRFNARNAVFLRIDVGFSHEGFQVWFKFNDLFNQRRYGVTAQPIY
jgi:outer membrane protein assembly factor BamA